MYMDDVYKRIPEEELELLSREIEMCRDAGGDHEYESYLAESVTARLYTEIEVEFAFYQHTGHYHAYIVNQECGHTERGHAESQKGFWWALRYALIGLGAAKIQPDQSW